MKIENKPQDIYRKFDNFTSIKTKHVRKNKRIEEAEFKYNIQEFGDQFVSAKALPKFNKAAQKLAETLVGQD